MVEQHHETVVKPSRSDEILDPDLQIQITNEIRAQFESMEPKRPTKPNRSESDDTTTTPLASYHQNEDFPVPEMNKLKSLNFRSQVIFSDTLAEVQEEFVETGYYKNLDCVDKQHHTTGSGFIKVASESGEDYDLQLRGGDDDTRGRVGETVLKSNPATNDWIPKIGDNKVEYVSSKPNRSESS